MERLKADLRDNNEIHYKTKNSRYPDSYYLQSN